MISSPKFSLEGPFTDVKIPPDRIKCKTPSGLKVTLTDDPLMAYAELRVSYPGFELAVVLGADANGRADPEDMREELVEMAVDALARNNSVVLPTLWRPKMRISLGEQDWGDGAKLVLEDTEGLLYASGPFINFRKLDTTLWQFESAFVKGLTFLVNSKSNTLYVSFAEVNTELRVFPKEIKALVRYITTQIEARNRQIRTLAEISVAPRDIVQGPLTREEFPLVARQLPQDVIGRVAKFLGGKKSKKRPQKRSSRSKRTKRSKRSE